MHPFDEVYIYDIARKQGHLFFYVREEYPGIDEKWFVRAFMKSRFREMMDEGNPKYLNMPAPEMLIKFIQYECNNEYPRGEEWGGFMPEWAGRLYALYQWEHNVPSKELVDILTLEDIERIYPALHQMGWEAALEKIHTTVLGNKR